jgi:drug/metabolite transporter (DMT)-like permease
MLYVVAALLLKRASDLGADVWRTTRIINYTTAVAAAGLWPLGGTIPDPSIWWHPVAAGALFFAGQIFTLLALNIGDVSVATPVLGLKILLVVVFTIVVTGNPISPHLWIAASLGTVAIALLNVARGHPGARVGTTIIFAALGAAAYACFDVLVQEWSPTWGTGRFLPIAMACAAIYSIPLRRFETSERTAGASFPWVIAGAAGFAVQGLMFMISIAIYRQATSANVLYSSRGLWSVVAVWGIGHWFSNREQHLGRRALVWRLIGAMLLMTAIVMVLTFP